MEKRSSTIADLMERRRIMDGAKEYHGHSYMDLNRFADDTRHMIIFDVLTNDSPIGWKGERKGDLQGQCRYHHRQHGFPCVPGRL